MLSLLPPSTNQNPNQPLLTSSELSRRWSVSLWTIYRWSRSGMPTLKLGRLKRFDPCKVDAWLAAGGADPARKVRTRAKRAAKT